MHEVGLCEAVLDAVDRRAAGRTVQAVRVRSGVMNRVDEESMRQSFALVSEGSVAEGAELTLEIVPITVECDACDTSSVVDDVVLSCPRCGDIDVRLNGGDELTLVSIDVAPSPVLP
jgi:hydrogenase nickel incorporation protein HypA/HybF